MSKRLVLILQVDDSVDVEQYVEQLTQLVFEDNASDESTANYPLLAQSEDLQLIGEYNVPDEK